MAQLQFPGARLRLATLKYDISPQQCRIRELRIFPLHGSSPTNGQQRTRVGQSSIVEGDENTKKLKLWYAFDVKDNE